jgi:RimJ/RimL family protein N-acetyltransferase
MSRVETERLLLRPFALADVVPLYAIQGDREAMRFTRWAESRDSCRDWLAGHEAQRLELGFAPWTVVTRAESCVVGWGGLNVDPADPGWGVEVSYFFAPTVWGRGFATELVRASLGVAFGALGLSEVGAFARPENAASIRVLEKAGFAFLRFEPRLERNHYAIAKPAGSHGNPNGAKISR